MDESEENTDDDSLSKNKIHQFSSARSLYDIVSKQTNLPSYSSCSSINSHKGKIIESIHSNIVRQHSTISSQIRALTEKNWQTTQKGKLI